MVFFHMRRALASSLIRALSSSSSSFSSMASSRSRFAFVIHPKQTPLPPHSLIFPIRFQTSVSEESPADDKNEDSNKSDRSEDSNKSSPPKETILLEGCDLNHWLIIMDFSGGPKPSEGEMVNSYVKTLAEVVGSEEEAKKKIYSVATMPYTGFGAEISEELSKKVKGLPGVSWVLPDSYMDIRNKDYGGDLFVDGKVIPRPKYRFINSQKQADVDKSDRHKERSRDEKRLDEQRVGGLRHSNRNQGRRG